MTINDGFLLLIRWFHAIAAVIWVGGNLFFVLVLRSQARRSGAKGPLLAPEALHQFRGMVDTCIAVLLVTGTILLFDRITNASTTSAYVLTATIKIGLSLWMFTIALSRWQRRRQTQPQRTSSFAFAPQQGLFTRAMGLVSGINLTVVLGIAIFFLSDLLAFIFQEGLTGQ